MRFVKFCCIFLMSFCSSYVFADSCPNPSSLTQVGDQIIGYDSAGRELVTNSPMQSIPSLNQSEFQYATALIEFRVRGLSRFACNYISKSDVPIKLSSGAMQGFRLFGGGSWSIQPSPQDPDFIQATCTSASVNSCQYSAKN